MRTHFTSGIGILAFRLEGRHLLELQLLPIPDDIHIIAVAVQSNKVSINTDNICTSPCFTGWLTFAEADAFGAEPIPASLE